MAKNYTDNLKENLQRFSAETKIIFPLLLKGFYHIKSLLNQKSYTFSPRKGCKIPYTFFLMVLKKMNPRTSLTILGILLIVLGIYPLAVKAVPSLENFPVEAGSVAYQSIVIALGILALFLSGKPRERSMPQYIIQK
jgi:hypothetical protein